MNVDEILRAIENLPVEERLKVYSSLNKKLRTYERVKGLLDEFSGSGKNIWGMDAQEYINQERSHDRF